MQGWRSLSLVWEQSFITGRGGGITHLRGVRDRSLITGRGGAWY